MLTQSTIGLIGYAVNGRIYNAGGSTISFLKSQGDTRLNAFVVKSGAQSCRVGWWAPRSVSSRRDLFTDECICDLITLTAVVAAAAVVCQPVCGDASMDIR